MSDLLDFARGPALQTAMVVFVAGVLWRLVSLFVTPKSFLPSEPRSGDFSPVGAALNEFMSRMVPRKEYERRMMFAFVNGWVFHVGLFIAVFFLAPHIKFFKHLLGLSWPNLPSNLIFLVSVITFGSLIAALIHRLTNPVQKRISTMDDYVTWFVTLLPVATGILATTHLGARYEFLIALHILSIALFLIWFPFGKLMHSFVVFVTRSKTGIEMARRGVKL